MIRRLATDMHFVAREKEVLAFWKEHAVFAKSIANREGAPEFTFYDGPPTANGKPHIGHILTRVIKDVIPRYHTMKGRRVLRKAGWDTHGLPVELEVEKQLGIDGKPQIEAYGVEPFIRKCKESVWKYKTEWEGISERVGFWADMEHPYVTYENDYIESEWWALRRIWDQDLLYKGYKVVPYCPRCGTALSSHEVAQGYKDVKDASVYVRFKAAGEDAWFAVWTTTPWTLPSNVGLCVNPDEEYVLAEVPRDLDGTERPTRYYLAGVLAPQVLDQELRILKRMKGRDLVGRAYEPVFPYAKDVVAASGKKGFVVTADNYVTLSDGTGIVHIAPAFGEDDARVGRAFDLPFVQFVGLDGTMTAEVDDFAGVFCKDADAGLVKRLAREGHLLRKAPYEHSYPFCWRCDTPLIYYARDSWFIRMTAVRDRLVANNRTVSWYPETIRDGRFGNFLENVIDWGISRERYWGTPLPIWTCGCGHRHLVGSIAELKEMALDCPAEIELHKPYIDAVHLKCPACGDAMTRVPEVIDCWFDSGSMPFAQWHYPFENADRLEVNFPADFISEAIDQTRGWFYTLMAISTLLFDRSPFRNCIVLGHVLDKDGQKMSKHKGNVVDPWSVLDRQGADAVRWYFCTASAPWLPSRFSDDSVAEGQRRFIGTFWNTCAFFSLYAGLDGFDPTKHVLDRAALPAIDRWILSRLHTLVGKATECFDGYDITGAGRAIGDFADELSNWYVRRNRERFWGKGLEKDKVDAFMTLYACIETVNRLAAPIVPFVAESVHQAIVRGADPSAPESVHLCDYPVADPSFVDARLERVMDDVLRIVALGRAARNAANLKNRQPLAGMRVVAPRRLPAEYEALVLDELNVKSLEYAEDASALVGYRFKPQLRTLGPRLGRLVAQIGPVLAALDGSHAMARLKKDGFLEVSLAGQEVRLTLDDLLVETVQPEGLSTESDRDVTVSLDTRLTPELIEEGFVREVVSKVQTMRKEAGFEVVDRIVLRVSGNAAVEGVVARNADAIAAEVLAVRVESGSAGYAKEWDVNGETCTLSVEKA